MVYFLMASLFESIAHPFSIMLSLPFAMVGVAWTLLLTGTPNNLMAKIGLMVLVGVVVNNGIVLIDHVNNLRKRGLSRSEAVLEGCRERFRPILMTACTTILGLVPLAFGTSGIFELRYFPLARTVMGGLVIHRADADCASCVLRAVRRSRDLGAPSLGSRRSSGSRGARPSRRRLATSSRRLLWPRTSRRHARPW